MTRINQECLQEKGKVTVQQIECQDIQGRVLGQYKDQGEPLYAHKTIMIINGLGQEVRFTILQVVETVNPVTQQKVITHLKGMTN